MTRIVRMVGDFGWEDLFHERRQRPEVWRKLIFEVEVEQMDKIKLFQIGRAHV